jgi:hypothetical protein
VLINSLMGLFGRVHGGSFTEARIQTLLLTNACPWAVAFDTAHALKEGLGPADVEAIRAGRSPSDRRHGALSTLTWKLIENGGGSTIRTPGVSSPPVSARITCSK